MPVSPSRKTLTIRASGKVSKSLAALVAAGRYKSIAAAHRALLERGLEDVAPAHSSRVPGAAGAARRRRERLVPLAFRADSGLSTRLRAYTASRGYRSLSEAIAALVAQALDYGEGHRAVPGQKADEVEEALRALGSLVDRMGPGVLGMLHLLAHWAVKSGSLKVSENDLLAEVHAVGESQWRQLLEEEAAGAEDVPEPVTH